MADLQTWQLVLIGVIFVWSGFVRSGLGFGGNVLSLPFLLLILPKPLVFLPLVSVQLLVFSSTMGIQGFMRSRRAAYAHEHDGAVDWAYLKKALAIIIVPKLIGVFGLLTLPGRVMSTIIFGIVAVYAVSYVLNRPFRSPDPKLDAFFLILGGYISGTSLIGAPLIIAVFANHVATHQLRGTLFTLWFILVSIKIAALAVAGVDMQLIHQLWLLPCATVGHLLGLRLHRYLVHADPGRFYRVLGAVLLVVSIIGLTEGLA